MSKNFQNNNQLNSNNYKKYIIVLGILVAVLIATNAITTYFWQKAKDAGENITEKNEFSLLNPARKLINQKDLIINFQPLRDYLNDKYEADPDIPIYFEYLPTGANISISKDAEFYPASLLKVPVAMAVAKKIEKGEWKWTNELVLMPTDKDEKFGTFYKEPSNSTHAIEEIIRRSLSGSDNTAHFILVRNLEMEEISDVYEHMGLKDFLDTDGKLSAKRYSVIFRTLYNSSYLTEENSQKLLVYLSQSEFDDYLQSGVEKDIIFSHKIGTSDEENVFIDSGIMYAKNRPYILTVMVKNKDEQIAQKVMADISEKAYNYVRDYE